MKHTFQKNLNEYLRGSETVQVEIELMCRQFKTAVLEAAREVCGTACTGMEREVQHAGMRI